MSDDMTRQLVILGAGGNAYDVLDIVDALVQGGERWSVRGFLDDSVPSKTEHLGLPVLGALSEAPTLANCLFVNSIRNDKTFSTLARVVASTGLALDRFGVLIDPRAVVSARARVGYGVYVSSCAVIAGGVEIGDHAAVGPGAIIGHNSIIGRFSTLAPGAVVSGWVTLGSACYIGAGAVLKQGVSIGAGALVGMGAVVTRDVADGQTVVGNPARPMVGG
jgi:sugar O-acyltransferase (sialic acid O-acetyltransferase NeuD family)